MVLSKEIVIEFKVLDDYLFGLLNEYSQKPSVYVVQLNDILEKISKSINLHMHKRLHTINLYLTI